MTKLELAIDRETRRMQCSGNEVTFEEPYTFTATSDKDTVTFLLGLHSGNPEQVLQSLLSVFPIPIRGSTKDVRGVPYVTLYIPKEKYNVTIHY